MRESKGFPKKLKKQDSITKLKKKAWTWFSLWIRLRGADLKGFNKCVTCGVYKHFRELQAGHFTPGRRGWILFDERGCWPQCYRCNIRLKSNPRQYDRFMRQKFNQEVIEQLDRAALIDRSWTTVELKEIANTYKVKAERLLKKYA